MHKLFCIFSCMLWLGATAQNVGIGTSTPTRAGLVVTQKAGETYGLFGVGGNSISLTGSVLNNNAYVSPSIGFNMYQNNGDKRLQFAHAGKILYDQIEGDFHFFSSEAGPADEAITSYNRPMTLYRDGSVYLNRTADAPMLAGFNSNARYGKNYAVFGSNTTGVSIQADQPVIGFNTYAFPSTNNQTSLAVGYGASLALNSLNGDFYLASSGIAVDKGEIFTLRPQLLINKFGNIGMGTTNPTAKLHLVNSNEDGIIIENTSNLGSSIPNAVYFKSGDFFMGGIKSFRTTNSNNRLSFFTGFDANRASLSEKLTIRENGMVGIGITQPATRLHIVDAGINPTLLTLENQSPLNSGVANRLVFKTGNRITGEIFTSGTNAFSAQMGFVTFGGDASGTAGGVRMVISENGLVGIGNNNPTRGGLVVDRKIGAVNAMFGSNTTGVSIESDYPGIGLNTYWMDGRKFIAGGHGGLISLDPSNGNLSLMNSATTGAAGNNASLLQRLVISKDGNIGVQGNTAPGVPLSFNNLLGNKISFWGNASSNHYGMGLSNSLLQVYSATIMDDIAFGYGSSSAFTERMRIRGNGNIGIGTSSPQEKLTVKGNGTGIAQESSNGLVKVALRADDQGGTWVGAITNSDLQIIAGLTRPVMFFQSSTLNAGVGTSAPQVRFQVGNSGDGTIARANAWQTFSDERYKKDIVPIANALEKLESLQGYYYYWKDGTDANRQAGLLAQEVEKVLPEIVNTDSQGYKSVDYGKMNALLLQALKEQGSRLAALEEEMKHYRSKSKPQAQ